AGRIEKGQAQRCGGDLHLEIGGGQPRRLALHNLEGRGGAASLPHVPWAGLHPFVVQLHAHDAGRADGEGDTEAVIRTLDAGSDALEPRRAGGDAHELVRAGRMIPEARVSSIRPRSGGHGGSRLVTAGRVVYRAATSRIAARAEPTRGCPMSDRPIPGSGSDHLSRRTFLRAAGATGAAALSPAILRRRGEAP